MADIRLEVVALQTSMNRFIQLPRAQASALSPGELAVVILYLIHPREMRLQTQRLQQLFHPLAQINHKRNNLLETTPRIGCATQVLGEMGIIFLAEDVLYLSCQSSPKQMLSIRGLLSTLDNNAVNVSYRVPSLYSLMEQLTNGLVQILRIRGQTKIKIALCDGP